MNDTIVAIATAQAEGAIAILRMSGSQSIAIAQQLFHGKQQLDQVSSHTIHFGKLIDPKEQRMLDEVLVSVFRAPNTFTREDIIEINCHGGIEVTQEILQILLSLGARLAKPGEFTQRAFENGRIDLTQAEAIADIISAENKRSLQVAVDTLDGKLSQKIREFRRQIIEIIANIEVNIDYPEYDDVEHLNAALVIPKVQKLLAEMERILRVSQTGQIIKRGIKTAIIGRPNVGKSSLLNNLLGEQKAIVTNIAGTTRDIVEGHIKVGDLTLHLLDTAGIRESQDVVERIGIAKSNQVLEEAELILLVLDGSQELTEEDKILLKRIEDKKSVLLLNKSDLEQKIQKNEVKKSQHPFLEISAAQDIGVDALYDVFTELFHLDVYQTNQVYLNNARQMNLLEQTKNYLIQVEEAALSGLPIDLLAIDLQNAYQSLGEIIGEAVRDDLLEALFSSFCLGK